MKPRRFVPTDLELELLKVVWARGQATVREVFQDLSKQRKIAYTTVLTMMGILEHKGHLKKTAGERAYIYRPTRPKDQVVEGMVAEFVNRVFSGSAKPLLVHLVEDPSIPTEDLAEVEKLLRARRKKQS
jgi:predicted transcriptional regulator